MNLEEWTSAVKTFSKRGFSALCFRHRNHVWPELETWKNEFGMVNICSCQKFGHRCEEMLTKPSQSEDSVLSAFGTETTFVWNQKFGRMKMERSTFVVAKVWTMMWRNATKTFSKRGFSALCLRHRNHVWPELEARKNEFGRVNIYCCQNFGQRCEEALSKPSQSVVSVLFVLARKSSVAGARNLEEWIWNGEPHLFLPKFLTSMRRNHDTENGFRSLLLDFFSLSD